MSRSRPFHALPPPTIRFTTSQPSRPHTRCSSCFTRNNLSAPKSHMRTRPPAHPPLNSVTAASSVASSLPPAQPCKGSSPSLSSQQAPTATNPVMQGQLPLHVVLQELRRCGSAADIVALQWAACEGGRKCAVDVRGGMLGGARCEGDRMNPLRGTGRMLRDGWRNRKEMKFSGETQRLWLVQHAEFNSLRSRGSRGPEMRTSHGEGRRRRDLRRNSTSSRRKRFLGGYDRSRDFCVLFYAEDCLMFRNLDVCVVGGLTLAAEEGATPRAGSERSPSFGSLWLPLASWRTDVSGLLYGSIPHLDSTC